MHLAPATSDNLQLAHILALSLGGYPKPPSQQSGSSSVLDTNSYPPGKEAYSVDMSEAARPKRAGAEFVVVRRGFVFHQPHPASHAWEATYGGERDALRAYQVGVPCLRRLVDSAGRR